jgi:hypothetical protein
MGNTSSHDNNSFNDIQEKVNNMYRQIMGSKKNNMMEEKRDYEMDNIYDIDVLFDPYRGIEFPYLKKQPSLNSESISSDVPKYVEFIVCESSNRMDDFRKEQIERRAIHKRQPDHVCKANCPCMNNINSIVSQTSEDFPPHPQGLRQQPPAVLMSDSENPKKFMFGGKNSSSSSSNTLSSTTSSESSSSSSVGDIDIGDDDDDEEDEDGFMMEKSDINTSDIYKMQKRIFRSETETDDSNNYNRRDKLFNSEDRNILDLNSTSDDYMKKPSKNKKYY